MIDQRGSSTSGPRRRKLARWWRARPLVRQMDATDCGPSCLLMVLQEHGGHASISELRVLAETDRSGTTLLGLTRAARTLGFEAHGARGSYESLQREQTPLIAHLNLPDGREHFVVVDRVRISGVDVRDPAWGRRYLPRREFEQIWTSRAVLLLGGAALGPSPPPRFTPLNDRWRFLRPYRMALTWTLLLGFLSSLLGFASALATRTILDTILPTGEFPPIAGLGVLLLALLSLRTLLSRWRVHQSVRLSEAAEEGMHREVLNRLLSIPDHLLRGRTEGELLSRVSDATHLQRGIVELTTSLLLETLVILIALALLAYLAPPLAGLLLLMIPLAGALLLQSMRSVRERRLELAGAHAELQAQWIELFSGLGEIQGARAQDRQADRTGMAFARLQQGLTGLTLAQTATGLRGQWIGGGVGVLLLIVGSYFYLEGTLGLGDLVAAQLIAGVLLSSLERVLAALAMAIELRVVRDRLRDLLDLPTPPPTAPDKAPLLGGIRLEAISLDRARGGAVLREVDLHLPVGCWSALTGPNGAGKSTLLQLLSGRIPPTSGRILCEGATPEPAGHGSPPGPYGGSDHRYRSTLSPERISRWVRVVPDEVPIFSGALAENVFLDGNYPSAPQVLDDLALIESERWAARFPLGWMTPVGGAARRLSAGERQMVGLLRALAGGPRILLIDEGIAWLDPEWHQRVVTFLSHFRLDRSLLVVSHDPRLLRAADRILELRDGSITSLPSATGSAR